MRTTSKAKVRVAAVGDLHCRLDGDGGNFRRLVEAVNRQSCDALLLCGDLTDRGRIEEAELLAESFSRVQAPVLAVLGNHDFECGKADEVTKILGQAGIRVLDGQHHHLKGRLLGFAGVRGFCGGFDRASLQAFGEEEVKRFVYAAVDEAVKLEAALAQLDARLKVAVTHYAPVRSTCEGEHPEIMPFLGSSRLGEAMDSQEVVAAFHGHAHHGTIVGQSRQGTPVYNVALPLLRRGHPDRRVFIVELPLPEGVEGRELPPLLEDPAVVTPEALRATSAQAPRADEAHPADPAG